MAVWVLHILGPAPADVDTLVPLGRTGDREMTECPVEAP